MKKSIVLLDGNSLMFRAYYATAALGNLMQASNGMYTNAIYGFVNMVNKIKSTFDCELMLVAFDKGKNTFRHKQLESYKGTRKHMPEELAMQIPLIKEYLDIVGIKRLELDEYEADDIVGSMALLAKNAGYQVTCLSGDKDLLQLVDDNINVILTKKGITDLDEFNVDNFFEKMSCNPKQIPDYKAMIGDNSDNLKGVKGIGPKTATMLLGKYLTIENIYNHLDELSSSNQNAFNECKETCLQTKFLATIYQNINFNFSIDDCLIKDVDNLLLRSFYEKLEFASLIKKMKFETKVVNVEYQKYINDVLVLKEKLNEVDEFYFEVELDQENYHKANILGFSFIVGDVAFFIDKGVFFASDLSLYLENPKYKKYVIDSKKVIVSLKYFGININNITYDALIALYLINPSNSGDLKTILESIDNVKLPFIEEIYGKKKEYQIPDTLVYANYSMDKLIAIKDTKNNVLNRIVSDELNKLYYDIELPLSIVLSDMEFTGFKVNVARLNEIGVIFKEKILEEERKIYNIVGREFNIASPKQLGIILFEELKVGKGKKNKTGYSTSAEVLENLKDEHEIINMILEYRKYTKLYSTYVQGLKNEIKDHNLIHTTFNQTLTQTGRLSSTEPNIQNIPIRTEEGKTIRSAFISRFNNGLLVSADYSQIELRILAHMSKCKSMIDDFNSGLDLHKATAAKINNVAYDDITKSMRSMAKAVNFGIVYGMSDWGLSEQLHILPIEAQIFIEKYFSIYPEIKTFLEDVVKDATITGFTKTIFGRRRYISELTSQNYALRQFGERTSKNAPIQGSAADIIKLAMVKVYNKMQELNLQSKMVVQVHDEIIIDCVSCELDIVKKILKEEMENVIKLDVVLEVDVESGTTWDLK